MGDDDAYIGDEGVKESLEAVATCAVEVLVDEGAASFPPGEGSFLSVNLDPVAVVVEAVGVFAVTLARDTYAEADEEAGILTVVALTTCILVANILLMVMGCK